MESKDVEVSGNIQFFRWQQVGGSVTPALLGNWRIRRIFWFSVTGLTGNIWGEKSITVKASTLTDKPEGATAGRQSGIRIFFILKMHN